MPHAAEIPDKAAPEPARKPSPPPEPASATVPGAAVEPKSELFRALVEAGAGAVVAYTADRYVHSMTAGNVALQLQPMLVEMRRLFSEQGREIAELRQQLAELRQHVAEQGRQIATLAEVVARQDAKLDAVKRELRLVWGALGVLITLLTVVFGFLFRDVN